MYLCSVPKCCHIFCFALVLTMDGRVITSTSPHACWPLMISHQSAASYTASIVFWFFSWTFPGKLPPGHSHKWSFLQVSSVALTQCLDSGSLRSDHHWPPSIWKSPFPSAFGWVVSHLCIPQTSRYNQMQMRSMWGRCHHHFPGLCLSGFLTWGMMHQTHLPFSHQWIQPWLPAWSGGSPVMVVPPGYNPPGLQGCSNQGLHTSQFGDPGSLSVPLDWESWISG